MMSNVRSFVQKLKGQADTGKLHLLGVGLNVVAYVLFHSVSIYPGVFVAEDDIRLLGNDAYFHIRHADYAAQNFPHLKRFDDQSHFPHTVRSDACSLFDLGIAATALVINIGEYDQVTLLQVAAWTPVFLGACTLLAVYLATSSLTTRSFGLFAALVCLLYPGPSLLRSSLGFADHHVAEMLLGLLTFWGYSRCLKEGQQKWFVPAIVFASPMSLFLFTWYGAPLYIGLIFLAIEATCLISVHQKQSLAPVIQGTLRWAIGVLVTALVIAFIFPELVIHPKVLKTGLLALGVLALTPILFQLVSQLLFGWGAPIKWTVLTLLTGQVVLFLMSAELIPEVQIAMQAIQPKTQIVAEEKFASQIATWYLPLYGVAGILAVCAIPLVLQRHLGNLQKDSFPNLVFIILMGTLWCLPRIVGDYEYMTAVAVAVLSAVTLAELWPLWAESKLKSRLCVCSLIALLVVPICFGKSPLPWMPQAQLAQVRHFHNGWAEAMSWLRENADQDSGVMSAWDMGNFVSAKANKKPVWSRYPKQELSEWLFVQSEKEADSILDKLCQSADQVRYLIFDDRTTTMNHAGHLQIAQVRPMAPFLPSVVASETGTPIIQFSDVKTSAWGHQAYFHDANGAERYRLVYESPDLAAHVISRRAAGFSLATFRGANLISGFNPNDIGKTIISSDGLNLYLGNYSSVKIFERVPGANVTGKGEPGNRVELSLKLLVDSTQRHLNYKTSRLIPESGVFSLRVPYSTDAISGSEVSAQSSYRLAMFSDVDSEEILEGRMEFELPEQAIQNGKSITLDLTEMKRPTPSREPTPTKESDASRSTKTINRSDQRLTRDLFVNES